MQPSRLSIFVEKRLFVIGFGLFMLAMPAVAASPYDQYYKQQEDAALPATTQNAPATIDNDQYYTAPGQYIDNKNYTGKQQAAPSSVSKGCNSISDSPECLGD